MVKPYEYKKSIQDTAENRDILNDILSWYLDTYYTICPGWNTMDNLKQIIPLYNDLKSYEWCKNGFSYATFVKAKHNLSGSDKKYGEILAKFGNTGTDVFDWVTKKLERNAEWESELKKASKKLDCISTWEEE